MIEWINEYNQYDDKSVDDDDDGDDDDGNDDGNDDGDDGDDDDISICCLRELTDERIASFSIDKSESTHIRNISTGGCEMDTINGYYKWIL